MDDSDKKKFAMVITAMASTYRQETTAAMIEGYWLGLSDMSIKDVERAVTEAIRTSKFMPSVAELRENVTGRAEDRAALAWDVAEKTEHLHGYYHSVNFNDPLINATIRRMGGWVKFTERLEREETKWLQREFEKAYVTYMRTGVGKDAMVYLEGFFEQSNRGRFEKHIKPPIQITTNLPEHKGLLVYDPPKEIKAIASQQEA